MFLSNTPDALCAPQNDRMSAHQAAARAAVRDMELRILAGLCTRLLAEQRPDYRAELIACAHAAAHRAAEFGATPAQISTAAPASLTASTNPEDTHMDPQAAEITYVRITLANGNYAQWIDYGPTGPALVNWYTPRGFACIDKAAYHANETGEQAIARLTAINPAAEWTRPTRAQVHAEHAPPAQPGPAAPTTTEDGQSQC